MNTFIFHLSMSKKSAFFVIVAVGTIALATFFALPDGVNANSCGIVLEILANGSEGPVTIPYNTAATITWTSSAATSCTISPTGWTGLSGSHSTGNLTSSKTYTLTCSNSIGQNTDSVTVNIGPPPKPTVTLNANPTSITQGNSSTLTWSSSNATSCTASGGWTGTKTLSGNQMVTPAQTTIYTITCSNNFGSKTVNATVTVTIPTPLPAVSIIANPNTIVSGNSSILQWSSTNATSCTASNGWTGTKSTSGTQSITPTQTATYTITCSNSAGQASDSTTITVTSVTQPPTVSITATPSSIIQGDAASLTWSSSNATSCTASGGWTGTKTLSGNQTVSPTQTTTYIITCSNSSGSATDNTTVSVNAQTPLPTVSIVSNPGTINQGGSSILTWSSNNATSCSASGGWSGSKSLTGNQTITPTQTTSYTITCSNSAGSVNDTTTINVTTINNTSLPTVSIVANPSTINQGDFSSLTWSSSNATSCFATNGWSGSKGFNGSQSVNPSQTTTYTITCSNSAGQATDSTTVSVQNISPQPTVELTVAPGAINQGENAVIVWSSSNAASCFASGGWSGAKTLAGSQTVSPSRNTTYTITCSNASRSAFDTDTLQVGTIQPPANNFTVVCTASADNIFAGNSVTFVAGTSGGINPITFQWSGAIGGFGQSRTIIFSNSGTKIVQVTATDAQGRAQSATCSTEVRAIATTPPPVVTTSTPPPTCYYYPYVPVATAPVNCGTVAQTNCVPSYVPIYFPGQPLPQPQVGTNFYPYYQIPVAGNVSPQTPTTNGNRSLLASLFVDDSGSPSMLLYLLLLLIIALTIGAVVRYHFLLNKLSKNGNMRMMREQEYPEIMR